WRDVWMGALLTSTLFTGGKLLIGLYLGRSSFGSAYGAAGSLVVLIVWVYYAAQVFLFGAELAHVYARRHGTPAGAAAGAAGAGPRAEEGGVRAARAAHPQERRARGR